MTNALRNALLLTVTGACFLLANSVVAEEVGYTTTWSKAGDIEGFETRTGRLVHVDEGGHPLGFLKTEKTTTIVPKPYLRNNLGKLFGTGPGTISFDLKVLGDQSVSGGQVFLSTGTQAFRYFFTAKQILGHDQTNADGWVHYELPWQASWTTAQAIAKKWIPYSGERDQWANVIDNPIWSDLQISFVPGSGTTDPSIGIDNFRIEAGQVLDAESLRRLKPAPPQQAPVAHFAFDEGTGNVLHDRSGNNAHAEIHGAAWVPNGGRWALEFDGDDFVDCGDSPSVNVLGAQTLSAWIYAEPIFSVFHTVPVLGNGSCQINQRVNTIEASGGGFLPFRKWVHVAQSWDARTCKIYIDGTLASVVSSQEPSARARFLLANPRQPRFEGEPEEYDRRFKGRIASVRLYNRALTREEIHEDLRTSNITNSVMPMPIPQPGLDRIKVEVDAARLGKSLENIHVTVEILKAGADGGALLGTEIREFDQLGRGVVDIDAPSLPSGRYVVRATAKDAAGKSLGVPGDEPIDWAGSVQFPSGPVGARRLNNLVTELLHVPGRDDSGAAREFVNPRTGFVFFSNRGSAKATLAAQGSAEATDLALSQEYGGAYEALRYLPKGSYTIRMPVAKELIVRAIAQTVHDYAHTHTVYVAGFGPYAGEFEERYVFPHMNTFLVQDGDIEKPFAKELKAKGRRLLSHTNTHIQPEAGQSPLDALVEKLGTSLGFSHPRYDGYLIDEFSTSQEIHFVWAQALGDLLSKSQFKGRALHAWTYALYDLVTYKGGQPGRELVRALQEFDSAVQWECYVNYQRTELDAWRHIHDKLVGETLAAEQAFPGFVNSLIVVPYGYETAGPPWLTMTLPCVDFRMFLEMQVRTVATDPVFAGVRGMGTYRTSYADEETVRWMARLYRHYAIEGHTESLGTDPYLLTHIDDGDFEEQGRCWKTQPAEEDSIEFGIHNQFGSIQTRYTGRAGDTVLITRRSKKAPNVFSQEIKNLEPGRLYSFRMFSADHQDLSKPDSHAIRISFDNAELVPDKCFTHVAAVRRPNTYVNWHVRLFRAQGESATLRVRDWTSNTEPGGPIGQQLMYNFIKVQPYWRE
jgi:hypothetical protein